MGILTVLIIFFTEVKSFLTTVEFDSSQDYARKALDVLWERRQKGSDLVGTVINIHNGEWVRRGDAVYFSTTFVDSCE